MLTIRHDLAAHIEKVGPGYPANYEVKMMCWCLSKAPALITWGAGPCMIVVAHNSTEKYGGMAHLPGTGDGDWKKVGKLIQEMSLSITDPLEIVVAGGSAWNRHDKENPGFLATESLRKDLQRMSLNIALPIVSYQPLNLHAATDCLYDPQREELFILNSAERASCQQVTIEGGPPIGLLDKRIPGWE